MSSFLLSFVLLLSSDYFYLFIKFQLHKESDISVLEILKLNVISFVYIPLQVSKKLLKYHNIVFSHGFYLLNIFPCTYFTSKHTLRQKSEARMHEVETLDI